VDIHPKAEYNGMLYEEKGRGILAQNGQKVIIDDKGETWIVGSTSPPTKPSLEKWHDYTVVAQGNRLVHKLDGKTTVEVIDHDESSRSLEGILALQVHQGPPMKVQFRDIRLRELPEAEVRDLEEAPIPKNAVKGP
jgi:hypothetical protein